MGTKNAHASQRQFELAFNMAEYSAKSFGSCSALIFVSNLSIAWVLRPSCRSKHARVPS